MKLLFNGVLAPVGANGKDYLFNFGKFLANEGDALASHTITLPQAAIDAGLEFHTDTIVSGFDEDGAVVVNGAVKVWFRVAVGSQAAATWDGAGQLYCIDCEAITTGGRDITMGADLRVQAPCG